MIQNKYPFPKTPVFALFILLFISTFFHGVEVLAQTDTTIVADTVDIKGFKTSHLTDTRILLPEAEKLIKKGDKLLEQGPIKHEKALAKYLKAYYLNTDNAFANFKLGVCYSYITKYKTNSILYLEKAYSMDKRVNYKIHYYLGYAYQINDNLESAIEEYEKYIELYQKANHASKAAALDTSLRVLLPDVYKQLDECKTGIELKKNPLRVFIDNAGDSINSIYPDYDPFISADESMMIFTSRRENTRGGGKAESDAEYYEDIYFSTNNNGIWSKAKSIDRKLNKRTNDAIVGLSFNGNKMFIYRDAGNGNIFLSKLKGKKWSHARNIKAINSEYHESSASFSPDEKTLYFVSDRPGGYGGRDIYICKLIKRKKWSNPVNLGSRINTPYDEDRVYLHPNGKTMYFSSKGHNNMGGYDVFKSTLRQDTIWSEPENMGYPINSVDDDISFVLSANGKSGYYASYNPNRASNKDIYKVTFLGPEKAGVINTEDNLIALSEPHTETVIEPKVEVKENQLTILKGVIKDAITLAPLEAIIEIVDNEKNQIVSSILSNSFTGKYLISLPSGKNYGIAIKAKDYLFYSENIIIPASVDYQVLKKNIDLKKLDMGSKIVLKNIFFDFDKATIRPESYPELERLTKLLNEYNNIKIEISGHTDNIGSEIYNQELSQKRAGAVVDYLIEKGINKDRLVFAGYGFTMPLTTNDTEEGRQLNRRTEFKVIGTDFKDPNKLKNLLNLSRK